MSARWEQIGAARYFGGAIRIAAGLLARAVSNHEYGLPGRCS